MNTRVWTWLLLSLGGVGLCVYGLGLPLAHAQYHRAAEPPPKSYQKSKCSYVPCKDGRNPPRWHAFCFDENAQLSDCVCKLDDTTEMFGCDFTNNPDDSCTPIIGPNGDKPCLGKYTDRDGMEQNCFNLVRDCE